MSKKKSLGQFAIDNAKRRKLKVGDTVRYRESRQDPDFTVHTVREVVTMGIPSCPLPMVMLSNKAGVVLASHCELVEANAV